MSSTSITTSMDRDPSGKLTLGHVVRGSSPFMALEDSLLYLQELSTCPCSDHVDSSPELDILVL
jgi:hypothetical protein